MFGCKKWEEVNSGSKIRDVLFPIIKESPAYKDWEERGFPQGNAGIILLKRGKEFRIEVCREFG